MKKILLIAGLGLLTTAGVTAAVLSGGGTKEKSKESCEKKECDYKPKCASKRSSCNY